MKILYIYVYSIQNIYLNWKNMEALIFVLSVFYYGGNSKYPLDMFVAHRLN